MNRREKDNVFQAKKEIAKCTSTRQPQKVLLTTKRERKKICFMQNAMRCWSILNWWYASFWCIFMKEKKIHIHLDTRKIPFIQQSTFNQFAIKSIVSRQLEWAIGVWNMHLKTAMFHLFQIYLFVLDCQCCDAFVGSRSTVTMESVHLFAAETPFRLRTYVYNCQCVSLFCFFLNFIFHSITVHFILYDDTHGARNNWNFYWVSKRRQNISHNITAVAIFYTSSGSQFESKQTNKIKTKKRGKERYRDRMGR